ncbi:flagellar motor switch protein FliM [Lentibacter algarum]|jgi:flagellar motor switch protein FliM|uniref:Flagellar motor switch protein FliM n=1 Tax=Lentibacter algarum TaxID=576131 RepID=A0A1H3IVT3_9RHOB|nr:flagellar motor switch protein FliM [Lentibacter algarum]SDY31811.1 flagellar motor switch protein FliM [Lentibacter algarum]
MASSKKLTSDEVNALIDGLGDDSSSASMGDDDGHVDVRPFSFGSDDLSLLGDYYALRMINERFCRFARSVFLPMLRIQPRISSFPPEVKTFDDYTSSAESFMSLTTSRMEELRGSSLLVVAPAFISLLTNSYYGGTAVRSLRRSTGEFTATEQRVIEIVTEGLMSSMQMAWRDLTPVSFSVQGHEENMQFASFVDNSETVIVCTFLVQLPGSEPATFDIVYPLQTLKPIATLLRSRVQSEFVDDDMSWRQKLERAILNIPLMVTAELAKPKVSMRNLLRLQSGDTFPIQLADGVKVLVEGKDIFNAELGQVGPQAALHLRKRIKANKDNV